MKKKKPNKNTSLVPNTLADSALPSDSSPAIALPLRGAIRFARNAPQPYVPTRCCAEPLGGAFSDSKTKALMDTFCTLAGTMFDAARGHFVCDEHGGALCYHATFREQLEHGCDHFRLKKVESKQPFKREDWREPMLRRAFKALDWMEGEMLAVYFAQHPEATASDFETARPGLWDEAMRMLTVQTALSVACALVRSDN